MFNALHRASFTVGSGESAKTDYVTRSVDLPESLEDLATLTDDSTQRGQTPFWEEEIEITVGYKQVGDKWERVYKKLPFAVAMFVEGYKLHVNSKIRPKQAEAGITEEDVKAFEAETKEPNALLLWQLGNAKVKKSLKDKVLAWKQAKA